MRSWKTTIPLAQFAVEPPRPEMDAQATAGKRGSMINRNRHEHPRRQSLASAGVADRHPILTHGLDGRRDIAVGVAQELLGLAGLGCRSEQRTALIVFTVNQDGQEQ